MEWKRLKDEQPSEGAIILVINRSKGYVDGKLEIEELDLPFVTKAVDDALEGTRMGNADCYAVSTPEYWCYVPDFSQLK